MNASGHFIRIPNGGVTPVSHLPEWRVADLRDATAAELDRGARLCAWFGVAEGSGTRVMSVLAYDAVGELGLAWSAPCRGQYPS